MNTSGSRSRKGSIILSQESPVVVEVPGAASLVPKNPKSGGFCRNLCNCLVMGSMVKQSHRLTLLQLRNQVKELEKEVEKQKEMKGMFKMRLERTQDYLRHCLQIAQDNNFLDMITNTNNSNGSAAHHNANNDQDEFVPPTPPQVSPSIHHHSPDLSTLINLANLNGWYIHPHEIVMHEKVGEGTTADIHRATWRGLEVAVKCIYSNFFESDNNGESFFAQEVEILSRQRHRFVLGLIGACLDPPQHAWVVTEFFASTVKDWLHGPNSRRVRERTIALPSLRDRVRVAMEISQGVEYLHQQTPMVIHRDLKLSNVFMDDAVHVRVADFGHARFLSDSEKALTGETGTYVYMAPEVIRGEPYDEKCDVYSFGIMLNELISGEYPYIQTNYGPSKIALEVGLGNIRPSIPEIEEQLRDLIELIQLCWDEDASVRPSFSTITSTLITFLTKLSSE